MAAPATQPRDSGFRQSGWLLALLAVAGVWARMSGWRDVFTEGGAELLPADSHYYVRFARLQLANLPRPVVFDAFVNFPDGAPITWPLGHAWLVALALLLGGGSESAAVWVGPAAFLVEWALIAFLAFRWLDRGPALALLAGLALLPAVVEVGALGNADHHVHEPMAAAALALVAGRALQTRSFLLALSSGAVLGVARLFTPSAFLLTIPLAAALMVSPLVVTAPALRRRLPDTATAMGVGAVIVLAAAMGLGFPGSLEYELLSAFHPLFAQACFLGAAAATGLLVRRWGYLAWIPLVGGTLVLLAPQLTRAFGHLGGGDPVLSAIPESLPLWRHPQWAVTLLGIGLAAFPAAAALALRRLRSGDPLPLPALVLVVALAVAAAAQARFAPMLAGAGAALVGAAWPREAKGPRWRRLAALALAAFVVASLPVLVPPPPLPPVDEVRLLRPTLEWVRTHTPVAGDPLRASERPDYGIAAAWPLGHFVLLWAERPVLATPFSQAPWHVAGNERAARILHAASAEEAHSAAMAAGARYVIVTASARHRPAFDDPPREGRAYFRMLHESAEVDAAGRPFARVFEVLD